LQKAENPEDLKDKDKKEQFANDVFPISPDMNGNDEINVENGSPDIFL
jgi:hypothetical protein